MGLDDFATGGTTTTSSTTQQTNSKQTQKEDDEEEEPFKTVGNGAHKKVFQNEEDWDEAADFMENVMNLNPQEVLHMESSKRHDVLHRAILQIDGMQQEPFHPTRDCIVCDTTFTFPNNWDFVKFKGEPACPDHEIEEVVQSFTQINSLEA